ncbi:MAG: SirB2 family protein [Variovorax sp.]
MSYSILKAVHVTCVVLSGIGFSARGWGSFAGARWMRSRAARTLPHVVDSVLLLSALALVFARGAGIEPWLAAKIVGLLIYIALGLKALQPGRDKGLRIAAWIGALATFTWIVSVALTKDPRGYFSAL